MDQRTLLMLATGAGLAFLLVQTLRGAKDMAAGVGAAAVDTIYAGAQAINPINQENIFYTGVNAVGGKLTGDADFSLGTWIYDATH